MKQTVKYVFITIIIWSFCAPCKAQDNGVESLREKIVAELTSQDMAWENLSVQYKIQDKNKPKHSNSFDLADPIRGQWNVSKSGMEHVRREIDHPNGKSPGTDIEEASYDGQYYMSKSNQGRSSGRIGHKTEHFLMTMDSPKGFGLFVEGVTINMPMSVQEFVSNKEVSIKEDPVTRLVNVEGPDPLAKGFRLELVLDPRYRFKPIRIKKSNEDGLYTLTIVEEYQELVGAHGKFWFPKRTERQGYRSKPNEIGTISFFTLEAIKVDVRLERDEFRLDYPKGALLLSSDTGESFYLSEDSTSADIPNFKNKQISLREHDHQEHQTPEHKSIKNYTFLLINAAFFVIIFCVFVFRRNRATNR